jgi:hypothetical protein
MLKLLEKKQELPGVEDLRLLSTVLKLYVKHLRRTWRAVLQSAQVVKGEEVVDIGCKVQGKLVERCTRTIAACEDYKKTLTGEALAMLYKLIGDCWRHKAGLAWNEDNSEAAMCGLAAYSKAWEAAQSLAQTNRTRRSTALNYSVFCYEVLRDFKSASCYAKEALGVSEDAISRAAQFNLELWIGLR